MKKIFTILALAMISVMCWAQVSITVSPSVIDFGTVELNEKGEAEPEDYLYAELDYTLAENVWQVFLDTLTTAPEFCEFEVLADSGSDFWYDGSSYYGDKETTVWVSFYAVAAGDYEMKYRFYTGVDEDWTTNVYSNELIVKVKVVEAGTTGVESIQPSDLSIKKVVRNGQMYIIRGEKMYDMTGKIAQ